MKEVIRADEAEVVDGPTGTEEIEVWGLVPVPVNQREYAFLTGPDDTSGEFPADTISLGKVLKEAIDQVGHMRPGYWDQPRTFRVTVQEIGGIDVTELLEAPTGNPPLLSRAYRNHVRHQQEEALAAFRDGHITHKNAQRAVRTATDARLIDVLNTVKEQVGLMHLRAMGRYTSYYIDKWDVVRLIEQLIEDIARGQTNVERILRYGGINLPESAGWLQSPQAPGPQTVRQTPPADKARGRHPRAKNAG